MGEHISGDIFKYPQFWLGDIWSHDVFRTISHKQKHFMDHKQGYPPSKTFPVNKSFIH